MKNALQWSALVTKNSSKNAVDQFRIRNAMQVNDFVAHCPYTFFEWHVETCLLENIRQFWNQKTRVKSLPTATKVRALVASLFPGTPRFCTGHMCTNKNQQGYEHVHEIHGDLVFLITSWTVQLRTDSRNFQPSFADGWFRFCKGMTTSGAEPVCLLCVQLDFPNFSLFFFDFSWFLIFFLSVRVLGTQVKQIAHSYFPNSVTPFQIGTKRF